MDELHPEFAPLVKTLLIHVSHLCALSDCSWYVASAFRPRAKQWEIYKTGRKQVGNEWVRIPGQRVLTYATPDQTPHCTMLEGKPASCALDIALVSDAPEGRQWLADSDPRWGIIGAAIGLCGASSLVWGGMWKSLRDFPHVELRDWSRYVGKGRT